LGESPSVSFFFMLIAHHARDVVPGIRSRKSDGCFLFESNQSSPNAWPWICGCDGCEMVAECGVRRCRQRYRIYVLKDPVGKVAKDLGRSPGTISKRCKTALKRYCEWVAQFKGIVAEEVRKFRARVEKHDKELSVIIDFLGGLKFYSDYLAGVKAVTDAIGPFRVENCVRNANGKCGKRPSLVVGSKTCGICVGFLDKASTGVFDVP
jgi:hypothetical protein